MKNIVILGSTGSIGQQTLDVIRQFPADFRVVGLSTNENIALFEEQIEEFFPEIVCVGNGLVAHVLTEKTHRKVLFGESGLHDLAVYKSADIIVNALSGSVGISPSFDAIREKKMLILANKESLVSAGELLFHEAIKYKVEVIPVDSELSAVLQLLQHQEFLDTISRVILTCSGGPFRGKKKQDLKAITPKQALKHPVWKMGKKISIDSATLMNKGMELIALTQFFGIPEEKIEVVIHKEGIVHSMIEFSDGQILAHMSTPDMRFAIAFALQYPERKPNKMQKLDFTKLKLTFEKPDEETFESLRIAREAVRKGGLATATFNAANESAVEDFLKEKITFLDIIEQVKTAVQREKFTEKYSLDDILKIHKNLQKNI